MTLTRNDQPDPAMPAGWDAEIEHTPSIIRYRYTERASGRTLSGITATDRWTSPGAELRQLLRREAERQAAQAAGATGPQVARKIMEMIGRLHAAGLESLYLDPGMSPSGCSWRYCIGIAAGGVWPQANSLGRLADGAPEGAIGGGWDLRLPWCSPGDPVEAYAAGFQQRYAALLAPASAPNPDYVSWYREMLERTAPQGLLVFHSDMGPDYQHAYTWGPPAGFRMPMPPGFSGQALGYSL